VLKRQIVLPCATVRPVWKFTAVLLKINLMRTCGHVIVVTGMVNLKWVAGKTV